MRALRAEGPILQSAGARLPERIREGMEAAPRSSREVEGGKMVAAAWKSGVLGGDWASEGVLEALQSSPPARSAALFESAKRECRADRRAFGGR
jgi:hypothetical protein